VGRGENDREFTTLIYKEAGNTPPRTHSCEDEKPFRRLRGRRSRNFMGDICRGPSRSASTVIEFAAETHSIKGD